MVDKDSALERDVALDTVAALEMFGGTMGSDETVIESVDTLAGDGCTVVLTLDNGQVFHLQVREVR